MNRKILHGDVLEKLGEITDNSIDCIITSPPYWGLGRLINRVTSMISMVDDKGRIKKGEHLSKKTEFKKGHHWKPK